MQYFKYLNLNNKFMLPIRSVNKRTDLCDNKVHLIVNLNANKIDELIELFEGHCGRFIDGPEIQ